MRAGSERELFEVLGAVAFGRLLGLLAEGAVDDADPQSGQSSVTSNRARKISENLVPFEVQR